MVDLPEVCNSPLLSPRYAILLSNVTGLNASQPVLLQNIMVYLLLLLSLIPAPTLPCLTPSALLSYFFYLLEGNRGLLLPYREPADRGFQSRKETRRSAEATTRRGRDRQKDSSMYGQEFSRMSTTSVSVSTAFNGTTPLFLHFSLLPSLVFPRFSLGPHSLSSRLYC